MLACRTNGISMKTMSIVKGRRGRLVDLIHSQCLCEVKRDIGLTESKDYAVCHKKAHYLKPKAYNV